MYFSCADKIRMSCNGGGDGNDAAVLCGRRRISGVEFKQNFLVKTNTDLIIMQ